MRLLLVPALLGAFILAAPANAAPTPQTGVVIAENFERGPGGKIGEIEAAATAELGVGWGSIYVSWATLQPSDGPLDPGQVSVYHDRFASLKQAGNRKVNVTIIDTPVWASQTTDTSGKRFFYPPVNPATFGNFMTAFAKEFAGEVDGYELGNEPDGGVFWLPGPDPAGYAGYAKAGIAAIQANDPTAVKFIGATAGANDEFMEDVLKQGVTGYDAVAFHSGTACKTEPPGQFIRDPSGNADIHANSSTGYRELIYMMRSLGIDNPVIADTAAGWATMPQANSCDTGASKDAKPGGVDEATQSLYLRDYFGCAESDPELKYIFIFSLYDRDDAGARAKWDHHMGLRKLDRTAKPSFRDLASTFASPAKPPFSPGGFCGGYVDHKAPTATLTTTSPVVGGVPLFAGPLTLAAKGTDEHPVIDIDLFADGKEIATTTKDGAVTMEWQGAKELSLGEHTITATAKDEAGNVGKATALKVKKVTAAQLPGVVTKLTAKVKRIKGRKVTITGRLTWPKGVVTPGGRVRIWFKKGKFVSKYGVSPKKPFTKTVTLRKPGKWTVNVFYDAAKPFAKSKVKAFTVRVR
jgi:hypothetical protein